jgi:hypothetical protein
MISVIPLYGECNLATVLSEALKISRDPLARIQVCRLLAHDGLLPTAAQQFWNVRTLVASLEEGLNELPRNCLVGNDRDYANRVGGRRLLGPILLLSIRD